MAKLRKPIKIAPSHKGMLHEDLGIPQGEKIPMGKVMSAMNSPSPAVRRRANFAKNAKKWNKNGGSGC